jgi:hypothetical protein
MAQNILLKRSNTQGKTPTTSSVNVGELAVNTYDGKIFFHKSGSSESIEQIVTTNGQITGSIFILGSGSFGEINVTNDLNVSASVYVRQDVVVLRDVDVVGNITGSIITASLFRGDGSGLTNVAVSPANNFDFNLVGASGFAGYIEDTGSHYRITPTATEINLSYNNSIFSKFSQATGYSGSLYGIGDILAFSGSVSTRLSNLEASSSLIDAGAF